MWTHHRKPNPYIVFVTEHLIREESDHQSAAKRAQDIFQATANQGGTQSDTIFKACNRAELPAVVAETGRIFDCSVVSATNPNREIIEELILGSGRPLILVPA